MDNKYFLVIFSPSNNGGVREVSDSLYQGFNELNTVESVIIYSHKQAIKFIIEHWKERKNIISITSLNYGFYNIFFKKSVFILHGYPYRRHLSFFSYYKNIFGHFYISIFSNKVIAVSRLTKYVWENHLGLAVDNVIYNPFTNGLLDVKVSNSNIFSFNKAGVKNLVYVGRLVASKNILYILKAVSYLRNNYKQKIVFHIVGEGPDRIELLNKYFHTDNVFHGYIDSNRKFEILKGSDAFISLNEGEPFGLTSLEAGYFNLNCVLPIVGGHLEFIASNKLFLVNNINCVEEIADQIRLAFESLSKSNAIIDLSTHASKTVALKYLNLFHEYTLDN